MNRGDRRKIGRLPVRDEAWEAGLLHLPATVGGEKVLTFGVVEAGGVGRHVATVGAGGDALAKLAAAFLDPIGTATPGRPSELRCADAATRARLVRELDGLVPVVAGPTPALDEIGRRLADKLIPARAPGITAAVGLWKLVLDRLVATAPWEAVADDVDFTFAGGGLDEGAAVLFGNQGESFGFAWFPGGTRSLELFRVISVLDPQHLLRVHAVMVNVDRAGDLPPEDVAACEKLGLTLAGGRYPWVVATGEGTSRGPTPAEQAQTLRALAAVVEARTQSPHDPYDGIPHAVEVRTPDGATVRVTSTAQPEELFSSMVYDAGDPPTLRGEVAHGAEPRADAIDGVILRARGEDAIDLIGRDGDRATSWLITLEDEEARDVRAQLAGGRLRLVLEGDAVHQERVLPCTIVD